MPQYSDDELLDALRQLAKQLGRTPTTTDIKTIVGMPSVTTYYYRFGSLQEALQKSGLDTPKRHGRSVWTNDQLIEGLKQLAHRLGRAPTKREVDLAKGLPSGAIYSRRFGSFNQAVLLAGLPLEQPGTLLWTKQRLLDDLAKLAKRLGRTPLTEDIDSAEGIASAPTYMSRFGTISEALRQAGLTPREPGKQPLWTDEELISRLKEFTGRLGRPPTRREIDAAEDMPSSSVYYRRFGTLPRA